MQTVSLNKQIAARERRTSWKLGNGDPLPGITTYRTGPGTKFNNTEMKAVRGQIDPALLEDLRAVHYELGTDKIHYQSDTQRQTMLGPLMEQHRLNRSGSSSLSAMVVKNREQIMGKG